MSRLRAIATVIVAAVGAGALAFAVRVQDHPAQDRHAPAKVVRPAAPKQPAPPWALDRCAAAAPASASPLDAIARAQASFAPARDGVLRGVSSDLNVIATWTDRRIWLSVDEGATWGRVLDAPGRVLAVHADQCGRVVAIRDGVLGTRLGAEPGDETWRALPAPVAGAFLGLDVRGAVVTITARAIAAKGIDRDDAPASLVSTTDRGATWSAVESIGDVAGATPVAGAVDVTPRACPSESPCSEIREGSRIERIASPITLVADPEYSKRWMLAPAAACGAALACTAFEGDALAPIEVTIDPPPISKIIAASSAGFLAIPAAADQDLIAIGPGFTRTILGSAGFPAAGVDMLGNLYGLDGA
ncbi:MAG TPA: hypothetical protein VL463_17165, partial [Kofleriaceae bacterium]|nr:hypothetical protein [Kofleriaceae bacterium]